MTREIDSRREQTKPCVHQDPETPQRLNQTCLECMCVSFRGTGQQWRDVVTGALAAADLGDMMCEPHHTATKQTMQKLENNYAKEVLEVLQISRAHNIFPDLGILQGT